MATISFEEHRAALTGHCYRMLGSVVEAEDAVQEAMLRAWKNRDSFRNDSSTRTWLYRIATNVCLDVLGSAERRRVRPIDSTPEPVVVRSEMSLSQQPGEYWVEPIPDALALPAEDSVDPVEYTILRESIRLAFVAALQYLPPKQRAVLLLTQVLNWSAAETAETLEMTVPAVNSALQRARATLAARNPSVVPRVLSVEQKELLARYLAAFEKYDVQELAQLLHEEVKLSMPPFDMWMVGHQSVIDWFLGLGSGCRGSVLIPVEACGGMPAFAQYREGGARAWAVIVLEIDDRKITSMTSFLDVETLFPRFGLPLRLEA
jgi:RNA polymerase sigma-70 factor (ECF subfamily)